MNNETKKINTFQGLRFIAFLGVFITHLDWIGYKTISVASTAVSFFFMLSGFVSMITIEKYLTKDNIFKQSINYTKNRIKKFYLLYLISIILFIPFSLNSVLTIRNGGWLLYCVLFILAILLLQTLTFNDQNILNIGQAGWYLSALTILSFITIPIVKFIKKINLNNRLGINILIIFSLILLLLIYAQIVPQNNKAYFFYYSPTFRIFEYFIGMILCNIYINLKDKVDKLKEKNIIITIIEIATLLIMVLLTVLNIKIELGLNKSLINISISFFALLIFSFEVGLISRLLSNRYMIFLGNISAEMYIIHYIVIVYGYSLLKKTLPINKITVLITAMLMFALTIYIAYIIHYKKYKEINMKNLKDKLIRIRGNLKRRKLKCKDFTIISNNCFAGIIYRNNNLPYMSPTCGLFIMPKDYIKFIYNMKEYLEIDDLQEINIEDSNYKDYLKEVDFPGTIGKLKDIEIMFLHYKDFNEAKDKWNRRKKRINYDKIIYKFSDQNECTQEELLKFNEFDAKNKLLFTAKKYDNIDSIVFTEYENYGYVVNDTKEKIFSKYINMYEYINKRFD